MLKLKELYGIEFEGPEDDALMIMTDENIKKLRFPQKRLGAIVDIIDKDDGDERWAVVFLLWDGRFRLATRWFWGHVGEPNSRGYPTWHVMPVLVAEYYLDGLLKKGVIDKSQQEYYITKMRES